MRAGHAVCVRDTASGCDRAPVDASFPPWSLRVAEQTFFHLITFLPDLLLLVLWLTVTVRHSRGGERSYVREAAVAVVIGFSVFAWTYPAVSWLNYVD